MDIRNETGPFGQFAPKGIVARLLDATRKAAPTWAGRRLGFLFRKLAIRQLHGRPLDVETFGARMRLYPYNNVSEKRVLFTPQFFDAEERSLLLSRLNEDFVFIDIGANIGAYSLFVAANAKGRCRVLSIEPQPDIFERLIYNIRQNDFPSVKALECAVTDNDGEITLFIDKQNRGETSVRVVSAEGGRSAIRVPARTLMTLVREEGYDHIDAIKLDVEGAEDLILEPFLRVAPDSLWPKLIIMEHLHQRWTVDLPKLLEDNGYVVVQRTRNNAAWLREG
jgi:FkbM family methyltransferase